MKVLVCDDLKDRCQIAVRAIEEAQQDSIEVIPLFERELKSELGKLFENVVAHLRERPNGQQPRATAFDGGDIIIIDNNLAQLGIEGTRLTAESIAGYIRAFSTAAYVISLNKNPDVDFDLRYLVGDYATKADLALNERHLANPALWNGKSTNSLNRFLPWYWPVLSTVSDKRRAQIAFVKERLDQPVLGTFGFTDDVISFLSLHARGALSPIATSNGARHVDEIPMGEVTFRDVFVASNRALPAKDEREKLSEYSKMGSATIQEVISRVVAADIDLWFRRDVLGPQEALVDQPHLLTRMPFLLGREGSDLGKWNAALAAHAAPFGMDYQLFESNVAATKFEHDVWVPLPCFWWPKLKADGKLNELFFAHEQVWPDVVFCEDSSIFLERLPGEGAIPAEFVTEFEGSWNHRFVSKIDGMRYAPRSRFAI